MNFENMVVLDLFIISCSTRQSPLMLPKFRAFALLVFRPPSFLSSSCACVWVCVCVGNKLQIFRAIFFGFSGLNFMRQKSKNCSSQNPFICPLSAFFYTIPLFFSFLFTYYLPKMTNSQYPSPQGGGGGGLVSKRYSPEHGK